MAIKTSIQHEKLIFNYMLKKPEYLLSVNKDFFQNNELDTLGLVAREFYIKYKETPSKDQMRALVKDMKKGAVDIDLVDTIYDVDVREYDNDWLKSTTEAWIRWRAFNKNLAKAIEFTKLADVSIDNIEEIVGKAVGIVQESNTIDFDKDLGLNFFDPDCHKSILEDKILYTWDTFNRVSHGGLDPKTLTSYIGATNVGKSVYLCNDAANFVRNGKNVVYITCEMAPAKVARRIFANLCDITMEKYDELVQQPGAIKKKLNQLSNSSMLPLGKLFIKEYPTGKATSLDIERYIKEVEETRKFKIDIVIIDYINIMCNYRNPNTENTYMKIKQLAEDLRGVAVEKNVCMITATQAGRAAIDANDITLEDVSESMALAHTCDTIFGIIQTPEMNIGDNINGGDTPTPYYWLKILKIREGEGKNTKFRVNANYPKMKLTEQVDLVTGSEHLV